MIQEIAASTGASVSHICHTLEWARRSYYAAARPSARQLSDQALGQHIERIFHRHRQRYGYRRIWHDLRDKGITCAPARVRRLMRERNLRAVTPHKNTPRTSDGNADKPSPNLVTDQPFPTQPPPNPHQVWAGDFTYIPRAATWLSSSTSPPARSSDGASLPTCAPPWSPTP